MTLTEAPVKIGTPDVAGSPGAPGQLYKKISAVSLIAAPALLLGSELAYRGTNVPAQLASDAIHQRTGIVVAMVLLLASSALLIPAASGVLHLARDRGRFLARAGVVFCTLGALGHAAYAGFTVMQLATAAGNRAEMIQLLERSNHSAVAAPVAICIQSFAIGALCLAFAARRAGFVGRIVPAAMLGAVLLEIANASSPAAGAAKETLGLIALGSIGVAVLRMSDRAWDPRVGTASATELTASSGLEADA